MFTWISRKKTDILYFHLALQESNRKKYTGFKAAFVTLIYSMIWVNIPDCLIGVQRPVSAGDQYHSANLSTATNKYSITRIIYSQPSLYMYLILLGITVTIVEAG